MKTILIILIALLNIAVISCKEQDKFADTAKPLIKNFKVSVDNLSFEFYSDTSKKVVIFLATTKLDIKEYNQFIKKFSLDTNDWLTTERIDNNFYLLYSGNDSSKVIKIQNLPKATLFYMYFFEQIERNLVLTKIKKFSTLDYQPVVQSQNIAFGTCNESQITVNWQNGDGIGRIVLIRKDSMPTLPINGIFYKASSKYKEDSTKINKNGTYCIYNKNYSNDNNVVVTNLDKGIYYFRVFEYNGLNESVNYLTDSSQNNPRHKSTSISAPVALPATIISKRIFNANWKNIPDVEYYLLDISEDYNFGKVFDRYNNVDVGDSNSIEIVIPDEFTGSQVYYRVRAFSKMNLSKNSNTVTVDFTKAVDNAK